MNFFCEPEENGGAMMSRSEMHRRIEDLYGRIDDENEKKEELMSELARIERAISRFRSLICDMEAMLK